MLDFLGWFTDTRRGTAKELRVADGKNVASTMSATGGGLRVFKQSNGNYRWLAISSNAFIDGDKEIVSTKALNQAVKRNNERFPDEFLFRLTQEEVNSLRSQIVTANQPTHQNYI